ncbi:fumarylacetoacetate hydrolase family protein [Streptomyces chartreusis]
MVFMKDPGAVVGPYDQVLVPRGSVKTDWEVELAVVIGSRGRFSTVRTPRGPWSPAMRSATTSRSAISSWSGNLGKSRETFTRSAWLVTADEVGNPQDLGLHPSANGVKRQDGHTSDMIFPVDHTVAYLEPVHGPCAGRRDQHRYARGRHPQPARHPSSPPPATPSSCPSTGSAASGRPSAKRERYPP